MRGVFDPRQLLHAPVSELHNGAMTPYSETPARAEATREFVILDTAGAGIGYTRTGDF